MQSRKPDSWLRIQNCTRVFVIIIAVILVLPRCCCQPRESKILVYCVIRFLSQSRAFSAEERGSWKVPGPDACYKNMHSLKIVLKADSLCVRGEGGEIGSVQSVLTCGKCIGHNSAILVRLSLSGTMRITWKKLINKTEPNRWDRIVTTSMGSLHLLFSIFPFALPSPPHVQNKDLVGLLTSIIINRVSTSLAYCNVKGIFSCEILFINSFITDEGDRFYVTETK